VIVQDANINYGCFFLKGVLNSVYSNHIVEDIQNNDVLKLFKDSTQRMK
jgi:hypothetical protein